MRRAVIVASSVLLFAATAVFAQTLPEGVTQVQMDAALADVSALYGSPVVRIDQARAICNQEQYLVECAEIGQKHGLFPGERQEQVGALLDQFKGRIIEELKQCGNIECLVGVAASLAEELNAANPRLAEVIDLTPQKVDEKRAIVEVAREVGVTIDECRTMDPDTASVELLRSCARLAKHERIQQYIPEADRGKAEKTESTAALKEALASGAVSCGDNTIEGCRRFCLTTSAEAREQGVFVIP